MKKASISDALHSRIGRSTPRFSGFKESGRVKGLAWPNGCPHHARPASMLMRAPSFYKGGYSPMTGRIIRKASASGQGNRAIDLA
jgi:hypothetical protein